MKITTRLSGLLTLALAAFPACAQTAAPATMPAASLLQSGIYEEETVGDLNAAAKTYQQLLENAAIIRPYAAQAAYRLAMIQLKQKNTQDAIATLTHLTHDYPDQTEFVAKANSELARARTDMTDDDLKKAVDAAVNKISTLAEADPLLPPALASLEHLDGKRIAADLLPWFTTGSPEQRRAAIYILWRGPLSNEDVAPALPALLKLLAHEEEATRGMAALALGTRKIPEAYNSLADMALHDDGSFSRRAAVYALGLLGDEKATTVLQYAAKDKDKFVASNARAALKMLELAAAPINIEELKSGRLQIANIGNQSLEATLRDLKQRIDADHLRHDNQPGPDAEYLNTAKQTIITELSHRGYAFADDQIVARPDHTTRPDDSTPTVDSLSADDLASLAWKQWFNRKYAEAESLFQKSIAKDPTRPNTLNGLGWSQLNLGKSDAARASFQKAVALDPKAAASWNGLGWIAKNAGKPDEAIEDWTKSYNASPTATAAMSGLASTYAERGDNDNAILWYQRWLNAEPQNADAKAGLEKATEAKAAKK